MKAHYNYSIKKYPSGYYVNTVFSYRELALLALVIWKYKELAKDYSDILLIAEKHLNDLLDQIDDDCLI